MRIYSSENLMRTSPNSATLSYDPAMRLYEAVGSGATTRFGYDGADLIAEYNGSNTLLRRYVHGPGSDEPLVWCEGAGLTDRRWLHADERGSIVAISDGSGTITTINRYDEYGIPQTTNAGRFQYTGQAWLPEIGLYYYKACIYSPTLGRFMQTDPIGYGDGINWYDYVDGDPVNRSDTTGLSGCGSRISGQNNCSGMSGLEFGNRQQANATQNSRTSNSSLSSSQTRTPRGPCESGITCAMTHDEAAVLDGRMTPEQFRENTEARGKGAAIGASMVVGGLVARAVIAGASGKVAAGGGVREALFARGSGILNTNKYIRIGWGPQGTRKKFFEQFRIAVGNKNALVHWHLDLPWTRVP